jgi:hypothetical protein
VGAIVREDIEMGWSSKERRERGRAGEGKEHSESERKKGAEVQTEEWPVLFFFLWVGFSSK